MTRASEEFDGQVPAPEFVSIETTRYCNFECPMCLQFQDGTTVTGPHMDQELFERVAHETFPHAKRFQPSVSGEPLMSKGLPFMLEEAQKYGVKTEFCTNASLLNEKMRRAILPSLGRLIVSFDGATKETFEWVREGGDFDQVVSNVKALCAAAKNVPLEKRPLIGLACVLMRRNIEELPELVDLAKEIGVDYLGTSHVHPVTELMKEQSLVHDLDLAKDCIRRALARAEEIGLTMMVQPLDQLIASTATSGAKMRTYALEDGVVEGLGHQVVHLNSLRQFPGLDETDEDFEVVTARRQKAVDESNFPVPVDGNKSISTGESIWVCDFLWNKTYVALDGYVKPCCVPGTPNVGDLTAQSFEDVWCGKAYARMREDLVRKKPVPFCRGCQHIRELTEPSEINSWLQGRVAPIGKNPSPLPRILDPHRERSSAESAAPEWEAGQEFDVQVEESAAPATVEPPTLTWRDERDASGYVVEFSLNDFKTSEFATDWHEGGLLQEPLYAIPKAGWDQAPVDIDIKWRVQAVFGDGQRRKIAEGLIRRKAPANFSRPS